ncbi:hypothetical protein [Helicobacter rodentium]|uniref:hypothetical protein n=1 Tax=Helicobacter rodentium TaxID=59617 RepID=UPI000A790FE3|nr:hypothetical protein [Helicobacter rodentium]
MRFLHLDCFTAFAMTDWCASLRDLIYQVVALYDLNLVDLDSILRDCFAHKNANAKIH